MQAVCDKPPPQGQVRDPVVTKGPVATPKPEGTPPASQAGIELAAVLEGARVPRGKEG